MAVSKIMAGMLDGIDTLVAWLSTGLKTNMASYCVIQTADSPTTLVSHDGSLMTIIEVQGSKNLIGKTEFDAILSGVSQALAPALSRPGHSIQVHFNYSPERVEDEIKEIYSHARATAKHLNLDLQDFLDEREKFLKAYCAHEEVHLVIWTKVKSLTAEQIKAAMAQKADKIKQGDYPIFRYTQNIFAAIPDLRDNHESFVRSINNEFDNLNIVSKTLGVHEALKRMRYSVDFDFTDANWRPIVPGDKIRPKIAKNFRGDIADILWPSLNHQLMPRDAYNLDLRTARIGDRIYSTIFIDLFPKVMQPFMALFSRTLNANMPWRMSFLMDGGGLESMRLKSAMSTLLSFSSSDNRLINDAYDLLQYIDIETDDAVIKLRVAATTWAQQGEMSLLRSRTAQLAQAIQGWGTTDTSEVCGDAFEGVASTMLGMSYSSPASATVASWQDVATMLPIFRPASSWNSGAMLFRTPDGKPWPYQPGSSQQTTWIDLTFARPGSGKSVLSNALNFALTLSAGIQRLPRIAIVDIGPSSSGLISLIQEALPVGKKHLAAYHRMHMRPESSINPFDTQLGTRFPQPHERAFLVNFLTLLGTPIGSEFPYDGISDMAGMIIDEAYKATADHGSPNKYTKNVDTIIDALLTEIGFIIDEKTSWWEVTDALFIAGFVHEAIRAQRYAVPLLTDVVTIARNQVISDLFGKVTVPTGETLINAFIRMISSSVREYPVLSRPTQFDLGDARIVSLDLDEVAKAGGPAAGRQTAVMYMLARYILAKDYYLSKENVDAELSRDHSSDEAPSAYRLYHEKRIDEIREDPKRIVYDEFHRTSKTAAVREQVLQDMREGRKWSVQISLLSQSLDDFDSAMVDFATSIFIMDAGPEQVIRKTAEVFGLSETAQIALRSRVHGPQAGGATFLGQFATKSGINTQLLCLTLGPSELWALNTTTGDAILRNNLYQRIGPKKARRILAKLFPTGSASKVLETRLQELKEDSGLIEEDARNNAIQALADEIIEEYKKNPEVNMLPTH
jgi:intracellular multiplication protein IcmB